MVLRLSQAWISGSYPQVAKECQDPKFHIERAMTALAQMLQKRDNEFQVNTEYCNQQTVPAVAIASTRDARRDRRGVAMSAGPHGGDVVQIASRLPACQSVIINATGP